ncbi:hypothetical protein FB107DRAFT_253520 [Schizophyllum commune]|nr:hypothetical protein K525DRAFT_230805 [Schizophyllum commune Loenen D]
MVAQGPESRSGSRMSMAGQKRRAAPQDDPLASLPLSDSNSWYYPSYGYDTEDEEETIMPGSSLGNWGNKSTRGARWVRRGKIAAWGPEMDDWQTEERARKRIKTLMQQNARPSSPPPSLEHLSRTPSPPLVAPYDQPLAEHVTYTSFVMDKAVTHTFRSGLVEELENVTNGLIEGEATMKRALGRLWQVISEDPDRLQGSSLPVTKLEEEDTEGVPEYQIDRAKRYGRAPDLTPTTHKLFLVGSQPGVVEPSHFTSLDTQRDTLEKSLATLRELQDDNREYAERLAEIREGLGEIKAQRNIIWQDVRQRAVSELQDAAVAYASSSM